MTSRCPATYKGSDEEYRPHRCRRGWLCSHWVWRCREELNAGTTSAHDIHCTNDYDDCEPADGQALGCTYHGISAGASVPSAGHGVTGSADGTKASATLNLTEERWFARRLLHAVTPRIDRRLPGPAFRNDPLTDGIPPLPLRIGGRRGCACSRAAVRHRPRG